ncbi:MAG: hypothetical protein KJ941_12810 [Bacteroidetes bacterium]|nr:hypothetical protein [Bacteroidota bacterium]
MSQKLEEAFRSSLQNQEVAFDPKAWEMMNARLDRTMPVTPKGSMANWWIAASVVGAIGIGASFYSNLTSDKTENTKPINQEQISVVAKNNDTLENETSIDSKENTTKEINTLKDSDKSINETPLNLTLPTQATNPVEFKPNASVGENSIGSQGNNNTPPSPISENIFLPKVGNHCQ